MNEKKYHPIEQKPTTVPTVIGWILILAYVIVSVVHIGQYAATPSRKYREGVEYYKAGDYERAWWTFFHMNFKYIDLEYYKNALDFYNDSAYRYASELIKSEEENELRRTRELLLGKNENLNLVEADYGNSRVLIMKVAEMGDEVYFGNYNQEKLKWIVVDKNEEGHIRLMCQPIVHQMRYQENSNVDETNWVNSSVRKWVNSSFYDAAFSAAQKNAIVRMYDDDFECYDSVGLMSHWDISGFNTYEYSEEEEDSMIGDEAFWLRGESYDYWDDDLAPVYENGEQDYADNFSTYGVRPAIWIDPSKVTEV